MKIFKIFGYLILLVAVVIFVVQNIGQTIDLQFFTSSYVITTEMILVVLIAFSIGIILGMLYFGIQLFQTKRKLRSIIKEYEKLEKEVKLLRNKEVNEIEE